MHGKETGFELGRLENAYGKMAFGANQKAIWMDVSRKRSFQEPELATSRKKLEQGHVYEERRGERKNIVDSQRKSDSAAHIVHYMENIGAKRLTNNLKLLSERWEQKTLREMMKSGTDAELIKKIYKNLTQVYEQRNEITKAEAWEGNKVPVKPGEEEMWDDQIERMDEPEDDTEEASEEDDVLTEEENDGSG